MNTGTPEPLAATLTLPAPMMSDICLEGHFL